MFAGFALFIAGQALLNLAIRQEWIPVRDPLYFEKRAMLRQHPAFFTPRGTPGRPLTLLALGSSRTQLALDAGRLGEALATSLGRDVRAFNFGIAAVGPVTSALYFRRLLGEGLAPDFVLVEVNPTFLAAQHQPILEALYLHDVRLRPEEFSLVNGWGLSMTPPPVAGWKGWVTAGHAYRYHILDRFVPVCIPCRNGVGAVEKTDAFGFARELPPKPDVLPALLAASRRQYAPFLDGYQLGGPGPPALRDILDRCRDRGIPAALAMMPEDGNFRSWYSADARRQVNDFARGLARDYGIPLIDATAWVPDAGFADGHHLTVIGAAVLTEKLGPPVAGWVQAKLKPGERTTR